MEVQDDTASLSVSVVKEEPVALDYQVELNSETPAPDTEPMEIKEDTSLLVVAIKAEGHEAVETGQESDDTIREEGSRAAQLVDDKLGVTDPSLVNEFDLAPVDLSKKANKTSDELSISTPALSPEAEVKPNDTGTGPWPVMLTQSEGGSNLLPQNDDEDGDTKPAQTKRKTRRKVAKASPIAIVVKDEESTEIETDTEMTIKKNTNSRAGRRKSRKPAKNKAATPVGVKRVERYICSACDRRFTTKKALKDHELTHASPKPYQCAKCDKSYLSKKRLDSHLYLAHKEEVKNEVKDEVNYECGFCDKVFGSRVLLSKHEKVHFKEDRPYECVVCVELFPDRDALNQHEKTHEKPYPCRHCLEVFDELRILKKHIRTHVDARSPSADTLGCLHCKSKFKKKKDLRRHEREKHPNERFLCKVCGKTLKDKKAFIKHELRHTGQKNCQCNFCGKMFIDRAAVRRHERSHTGEKPFKCQVCEKAFATSSAVAVHLRTHTGETPYDCKFCGKKFSTKSSVYLHLRIHSDKRDFKCGTCGREFRQKAALQMHERRHTGERPFKCQYCEEAFRENRSLIRHERIHTGEKPFICKYCGKAVTDKSALTRHEHSHSDVKRFQCSYCDKRFTWHQHQLIHELLHTGEKPHKCGYCDKTFTKKANLTEHERVHTGNRPYKCQFCDKAFTQRGACRTHEYTHAATKPYPCKRCDKSFSWQHLLAKHELQCHDLNAPLMNQNDHDLSEESSHKNIQNKLETLEKKSDAPKHVQKKTEAVRVSQKRKDAPIPIPHIPPGSLNARCQTLSDTVSALQQSIVSALGHNVPPELGLLNQGLPHDISRSVQNSSGSVSNIGTSGYSSAMNPGTSSTYSHVPHSQATASNVPSRVVGVESHFPVNLGDHRRMNIDMGTHDQRDHVMHSPTGKSDQQIQGASYDHRQQSQHSLNSPVGQQHIEHSQNVRQSDQSSIHFPRPGELQYALASYDQVQYVPQGHIMDHIPVEQIGSEVEVQASGVAQRPSLQQTISNIVSQFEHSTENPAIQITESADNSQVHIILSVPKT